MEGKKEFSLTSAIPSVICVVFVAETTAPVVTIGNSQFLWWIFLLIAFLLPYGLISSEPRTAYIGEGGIYDWVTKAYSYRQGAKVPWCYWINCPLWLVLLAVMTSELLTTIIGIKFPTPMVIIVGLIFIWIAVWVSFYPVSSSIWILDGAAVIRAVLVVLVGGLGLYVASTKDVTSESTLKSMSPTFDLRSLSFILVIIFNLLGFEVIYTFADNVESPKKQIPQAITAAGLIIATTYIFSAFGIGVTIPTDQISTGSGMMDSSRLLTGSTEGWFIILMAFLFLLTLFGNMIPRSLGVNDTACYVAENGDTPKFFEECSKKNDMSIGAVLMNGIVTSVAIVLIPVLPNQDLFWAFLSLDAVLFSLSYIPVFPAFYKLRKINPDTPHPLEVNGKPGFLEVSVILPIIMTTISLVFMTVPLDLSPVASNEKLPTTIRAIIFIPFGEVIICVEKIKRGTEENG